MRLDERLGARTDVDADAGHERQLLEDAARVQAAADADLNEAGDLCGGHLGHEGGFEKLGLSVVVRPQVVRKQKAGQVLRRHVAGVVVDLGRGLSIGLGRVRALLLEATLAAHHVEGEVGVTGGQVL